MLLSFSLLLRSVHKFHSAGTALMRKFNLYFFQRWTFVVSDVSMTQRSSCESYSSNWSQDFLCPSVKSVKIPAAPCPAKRNPSVAHLSLSPLHLCHHSFSAFHSAVHRPFCAETSTHCRIYNPILTHKTDLREDANGHKVI